MGPSKRVRQEVQASLDSEMLVMRALYCFLPEDQVRGKALKKLGVPSKFGGQIDWAKIGSDFRVARVPHRPRGEVRIELSKLTRRLIREDQREHYQNAARAACGMPVRPWGVAGIASPFKDSPRVRRTATTPRARPRTGILEGHSNGRVPIRGNRAPRQCSPSEEGTPRTERMPVARTKRPLFKVPPSVPAVPAKPSLPQRSPVHGAPSEDGDGEAAAGEALAADRDMADLANDGAFVFGARSLSNSSVASSKASACGRWVGQGGRLSVDDEWPEQDARTSSPHLSRCISSSSASDGSRRVATPAADMDGTSPEQRTDLVSRRGSASSSSRSGPAPLPVAVEGGAKRKKCSASESVPLRSGVPNANLPDAVPPYPQPCHSLGHSLGHSPDDVKRSVSELQLVGFLGEQQAPAPVPATIRFSAAFSSSDDSNGGLGVKRARTASTISATSGRSSASSASSASSGSSSHEPRPGRLGRASYSQKISNPSDSNGGGPSPPSRPSRPASVGRITPCPEKDSIPPGSMKQGSSLPPRPRRAEERPTYFSLKTKDSSDSDSPNGSRGSKESIDLNSHELGGVSPGRRDSVSIAKLSDVLPPSQLEESSTNRIELTAAFKRDLDGKVPASPASRSPTIASDSRRGRREVRSSIESSISSPSLTVVRRQLFKASVSRVSPLVSPGRSPAHGTGTGTRDTLDSPAQERAECVPLEGGDEALAGNCADDTDSDNDEYVRSPGSHLMARARSNSSFLSSKVSAGDTSLRIQDDTPWNGSLIEWLESPRSMEKDAAPKTSSWVLASGNASIVPPSGRRDAASPEQRTDLVSRRGSASSSSRSGPAPVPVAVEGGAKRKKCSASESVPLRSGVPNANLPDAVPPYPQPCHSLGHSLGYSPDDVKRSVSELQLVGFLGEQQAPAPVPATIRFSAAFSSSDDSNGGLCVKRARTASTMSATSGRSSASSVSSASSGSSSHGPRPGRLGRASYSQKSSNPSDSNGGGPSPLSRPSRPASVGRITPCPEKDSIPPGSIKQGSSLPARPRRVEEQPTYFSLKTKDSSDSDSPNGSRGSKESIDLNSHELGGVGLGHSPDDVNRSVSEPQLAGFLGEQQAPAPVPATISAAFSSSDSTSLTSAGQLTASFGVSPPTSKVAVQPKQSLSIVRLVGTAAVFPRQSATAPAKSRVLPSKGDSAPTGADENSLSPPSRRERPVDVGSSSSESSGIRHKGRTASAPKISRSSVALPEASDQVSSARPMPLRPVSVGRNASSPNASTCSDSGDQATTVGRPASGKRPLACSKHSVSMELKEGIASSGSKSSCPPKVALQDATNRPVEADETEARGSTSVSSGARSSLDLRPRPAKRVNLSIGINPFEECHPSPSPPKGGPLVAVPQRAEPASARIVPARPPPEKMVRSGSGLSDLSLSIDSPSFLHSDDSLLDEIEAPRAPRYVGLLSPAEPAEPAVSRRADETPHRPIQMPLLPKKISVGEGEALPPSQSSGVLQGPPSSTPPSTISYAAPRPRQSVGIDVFMRGGVQYLRGEESRRSQSTSKDSQTPPGSEDVNVTNLSSLYSPIPDDKD